MASAFSLDISREWVGSLYSHKSQLGLVSSSKKSVICNYSIVIVYCFLLSFCSSFSNLSGELFLVPQLHRDVALLVLKAALQYVPDATGSTAMISESLKQVSLSHKFLECRIYLCTCT